MSGRYLTELADVLRAAGLTVREYEGWATRARGSGGYDEGRPWCVMWHHTASSASAATDARYCAEGDPDAPVCNLLVTRDGSVDLIAAGASNTNGTGDPLTFSRGTVPADSMNTHAVGMEICNSGLGEPYPEAQIDAAFTASLAICAAYGLEPADAAQHHDYTDRKIDPATAGAVQGSWRPASVNSSGSWRLEDVRAELTRRATDTDPEGDTVTDTDIERIALAVWDTRMQLADGTSSGTLLVAGAELAEADVQRIALAVWDTRMQLADGTSSGTLLVMIQDIAERLAALEAGP